MPVLSRPNVPGIFAHDPAHDNARRQDGAPAAASGPAPPYHEGVPGSPPLPTVRAYTPTALPPVGARLAAFAAIVVAGICGGLLTFAVVDLQCGSEGAGARQVFGPAVPGAPSAAERPAAATSDGCDLVAGGAGLLGAVASAGGVSVVTVLVLRAMAEWRRNLVLHDSPAPPIARQRTSRSRRKPSA